jgi:hypothetical protein
VPDEPTDEDVARVEHHLARLRRERLGSQPFRADLAYRVAREWARELRAHRAQQEAIDAFGRSDYGVEVPLEPEDGEEPIGPVATASGTTEALAHINERQIEPPIIYSAVDQTEAECAARWPGMGFDPDSDALVRRWSPPEPTLRIRPSWQDQARIDFRDMTEWDGERWVPGVSRPSGQPESQPHDTYGYSHLGYPIHPNAEETCWADVWHGTTSDECGGPVDPDSALGLCTKHEADKQRFNEERSPQPPVPRPAVGLDDLENRHANPFAQELEGRVFDPDDWFARNQRVGSYVVITNNVSAADLSAVFEPVAEAVGQFVTGLASVSREAFTPFYELIGNAHNRLVRYNGYMPGEGAGYAENHLAGYRWRHPETREQWRVAGRAGDRHWIRTGPRRARYWK